MIALLSPGFTTILTFKATASKTFHMILDDSDDMHEMIEKVSTKMKTEIENSEIYKTHYYSGVDKDVCSNFRARVFRAKAIGRLFYEV